MKDNSGSTEGFSEGDEVKGAVRLKKYKILLFPVVGKCLHNWRNVLKFVASHFFWKTLIVSLKVHRNI